MTAKSAMPDSQENTDTDHGFITPETPSLSFFCRFHCITPSLEIKNLQGILCSTLFFIWWLSFSDCYHLNRPEIYSFPKYQNKELDALSLQLESDMGANSLRRIYNYQTTGRVEYDEFYMKKSKHIIDKIDAILAQHYGFTEAELDYITNYDIKYRMGLDA